MKKKLVDCLINIQKRKNNIYILSGDLGFNMFEPFIELFPENFINCGIAEQNMVGVASGIASQGNMVFLYSIGNFLSMRPLEFVVNDICYHNLNVKLIIAGAGFAYGYLGNTHYSIDDVAIFSNFPNISIYSPNDEIELENVVEKICSKNGPDVVRIGFFSNETLHNQLDLINVDNFIKLKKGNDIAILSATQTCFDSLWIADSIEEKTNNTVAVYSIPKLYPLNQHELICILKQYKIVISYEILKYNGSIASNIHKTIVENNIQCSSFSYYLDNNMFKVFGSKDYMLNQYNLSKEYLLKSIFSKALLL